MQDNVKIPTFLYRNLNTFDYRDLIGKTLEIRGITDNGITVIVGIDKSNHTVYVLKVDTLTEIEKENKQLKQELNITRKEKKHLEKECDEAWAKVEKMQKTLVRCMGVIEHQEIVDPFLKELIRDALAEQEKTGV